MLGDDEFAAWFRLLDTPGVGRGMARRLLAACSTPEGVFTASEKALQQLVGAAAAQALRTEPAGHGERLAAARAWLAGGADRGVLTLGDPAFPPLLLQTADPPLLLYVQGRVEALIRPAVAVVGSRHPTAQGRDNARAFAAALAAQGYVVISGLALGIDGAAHEGALAGASTGADATVAVVGTGLDTVYPAAHRALAQRVAAQGALVSEFAPGVPPLAENFPQRNRLIAGLTLGTVVVEAALRSGSLITARLAVEAGREVFAVPGSIHAPQSRGCHQLLRQGAKLVETAEDIVEELRGTPHAARPAPADDEGPRPADPLLDALGHDPVTLDALMARTGAGAAELTVRLLELELAGEIARLPGGLFQRRYTG